MSNITIGVLDIILGFCFGMLLFLIGDAIYKGKNKPTEVTPLPDNTEHLKMLLEDKSIEKINAVLDNLISTSAKTYMILNVTIEGKEKYITTEESEEMMTYIKASVLKNMTRDVRDLLGMIYKVDTDKDLNDLLTLKIKLYVLATMVNNNVPL
jgi:uncharacterized membrane protein required for colicin V production